MSPALNRSSEIWRFEGSDAIEIRDGITFDFYTGLPHVYSSCTLNASLTLVRYSAELLLIRAGHIYTCCVDASISDISLMHICISHFLCRSSALQRVTSVMCSKSRWNSIRFSIKDCHICGRVLNFCPELCKPHFMPLSVIFFTSVTHRLCKDVFEAGCIPQICQLFSQSPTLHSSCLRILVAMVTKTEGVTEVRKHLPINSLCKLLNSEPEVQVCVSVFCSPASG